MDTPHPLASRYRALLLCYPHDYRRDRAREIVDTMLDLAPAERRWPPLRHALNLIRHGMRCRLGRPASRTVVIWATLTALLCGLLTAAAADRLAWETGPPLPSRAKATAIFRGAVPGFGAERGAEPSPRRWVRYGETVGWHQSLYQLREDQHLKPGADDRAPRVDAVLRDAERWLRTHGWSVDPVAHRPWAGCDDYQVCDPDKVPYDAYLTATNGDTIIEIQLQDNGKRLDSVSATLYRATPTLGYPAMAVGFLLGAFAGWLVFGWASRRTEPRHRALRATSAALLGLVLFLWWAPMVAATAAFAIGHIGEPVLRTEWPYLWVVMAPAVTWEPNLVGYGAVLLALAIAALPYRQPGRERVTT